MSLYKYDIPFFKKYHVDPRLRLKPFSFPLSITVTFTLSSRTPENVHVSETQKKLFIVGK